MIFQVHVHFPDVGGGGGGASRLPRPPLFTCLEVDNELLSPAKSTYRRLHSIVTHVLKNTNDWYSCLEVFDTVGPAILWKKTKLLCYSADWTGVV